MSNINDIEKKEGLFDGRYKLLRTLSTDGGTADVWLAIDVNTIDNSESFGENLDEVPIEESGMLVAIKIYRPKNALDIEGVQRFRDEYMIVHNCRHTNLLQPNNFAIFGDTPYLELPYCKNGSSELLIGKQMEEKEMWKFINDVSSGLAYLHSRTPPIIHQDIKPANILIDDEHNYAITDFGISSQRGGRHGYYSDEEHSGTMAYMAPERFGKNYMPTAESDIWAFGATLYEILSGSVPYDENGGMNQVDKSVLPKPLGNNVPKEVQKIVMACLSRNPKERPTAQWIAEISGQHMRPHGKGKYLLLLVVVVCLLGIGGYFILSRPQSTPVASVALPEDEFGKAVVLLNGDSYKTVSAGLLIMDSLSSFSNYVPAMYELAQTYGWYPDATSLKRKDILGIEYHKDGVLKFMPVSDVYNEKAIRLLDRIVASEDSLYAGIKAEAAYRLAVYYANQGEGKQNIEKAKSYLVEAKKWATAVNNTQLLNVIDGYLK